MSVQTFIRATYKMWRRFSLKPIPVHKSRTSTVNQTSVMIKKTINQDNQGG